MTTTVFLADDQELVRAGFRVLLELDPDSEVVGEAADGDEAVRVVTELRPDVVVMDIRMPGLDGPEAARRILADPRTSEIRVLVLSTCDTDEYVFEALRLGASGFLLKDTEPAELRRSIHTVVAGDALPSPSITERVITHFTTRTTALSGTAARRLARLTDREREIVRLVATGMSNQEIAAALHISHATAKTHVSRALTKTGARDRAQLVVLAYEAGLLTGGGRRPLTPAPAPAPG